MIKNSIVIVTSLLVLSSAQTSDVYSGQKNVCINTNNIQSSLKDLPVAEIPIKASEIVQVASKTNRLETAKVVLKHVLKYRPQMVVQMVSSILKTAPETAPVITPLAISIVPQFAEVITRAAATSAPSYVCEIAVAVAEIYPNNKTDVINTVSLAVPGSFHNVTLAVNTSTPTRLTSNPSSVEHATGGVVNTINHGIIHPWPLVRVPERLDSVSGFDPRRYNN